MSLKFVRKLGARIYTNIYGVIYTVSLKLIREIRAWTYTNIYRVIYRVSLKFIRKLGARIHTNIFVSYISSSSDFVVYIWSYIYSFSRVNPRTQSSNLNACVFSSTKRVIGLIGTEKSCPMFLETNSNSIDGQTRPWVASCLAISQEFNTYFIILVPNIVLTCFHKVSHFFFHKRFTTDFTTFVQNIVLTCTETWVCSVPWWWCRAYCCRWRFATAQHTLHNRTHSHCNTLQHTATHCNTLQRTATYCNTLQHTAAHYLATAKHTLYQRTHSHCNTLQRTAAHCNTLFCNSKTHTP